MIYEISPKLTKKINISAEDAKWIAHELFALALERGELSDNYERNMENINKITIYPINERGIQIGFFGRQAIALSLRPEDQASHFFINVPVAKITELINLREILE